MSQQPDEAKLNEISKLFFHLLHNIQNTARPDWQGLDLTMAQFKVFFTLNFEEAMPISKVAEALDISHPTASHLVERLVRAGLVERVEHAADRRYTLARLSAQGKAMVQRLRQGRLEHFRYWLGQLDEEDLAALQQGLRALNRVVQASRSQTISPCSSQNER